MVSISKLLQGGLLIIGQSAYHLATPEQASVDNCNIIRFLGGSAPYIQHPGYGISSDIPSICGLEQGQLAFLNDYDYFAKDESQFGLETTDENSQGPFAGTRDLFRHGAYFRSRYNDLYNSSYTLPVFTTNSNRVHKSAECFVKGFLGDEYGTDKIKFNILAKDPSLGANTLTPRYACANYDIAANSKLLHNRNDQFLYDILERITKDNNDIKLTKHDIINLFDWCAYEINVTGQSPVCDLFTNDDLVAYAYYKDLGKFYTSGPGNNMSTVIGSVLLNASLVLLEDTEADNKIWLNFIHDTDIDHYMSALGIFTPEYPLPVDEILFDRKFVHANLVPQGARLYTEKYNCDGDSYVRFVLNDAVIPIPGCNNGPGFSCGFDDFRSFIKQRLERIDYIEECGVPANVSQSLTFYWDFKTKNYTAPFEV
ncbi:PHO5 [[Candida] subhashii]|uniref:PHO5 n=1 Tax=[Candida] subhashii TaxID=561895 RepID=A0A8J5QM32_9ASCO|nr:PHO5 [[Candida] subhashii]KAG7662827.1 PHO5 [[Candida] subhashii]